MNICWNRCVVVFLLGLLLTGRLSAQSTDAAVTGRITDPTKAVVGGAHVTAINTGTNVRYETDTNNTGSYVIPNLPPGPYRVEVEKAGFKTIVETGLVLHVQDTVELNYELALGAAAESITVTADKNNIDTTDGTVSTTIDRNFAENLPLNGRSFQTLILLTPGTVLVNANTGSGNGGQFDVNGQRANSNFFTVDGVSANVGTYITGASGPALDGGNPGYTTAGTTQGLVAVDALQEFKIQTSTYAPEFGRQPGGQVALLTRSGTNDFHGTAFDYLRNTDLDANNWFNDEHGLPKAPDRQNDFGGTFGGPVFKDQTFFFFSYEGLRLLEPFTNEFTVPSLCLRGKATCPTGLSPAAQVFQPLLDSFPLPNGTDLGNGAADYTLDTATPNDMNTYSLKVDQSLGPNVHLFGRYSYSNSFVTSIGGANKYSGSRIRQQGVTAGLSWNLRPNWINEFRFNYTSDVSFGTYAEPLANVGIGGGTTFNSSILYPAPLVAGDEAGWTARLPEGTFQVVLLPPGSIGGSQHQINLVDNMTLSRGPHQFKWGVDYIRLFPTFQIEPPLLASYIVTNMGDLTNGVISETVTQSEAIVRPTYTTISLYAQDTWRVSPRLSLTYGLRWEVDPTPTDRGGLSPLNVIGLPSNPMLAPPNTPVASTKYDDFAPRIGLAYQLRQSSGRETVMRGGFGIFYDLGSEAFASMFDEFPFKNSEIVLDRSFPVAANVLPIPPIPAPVTLPLNNNVPGIDPNLSLPYTMEWNVGIEQGLGENQSLSVAYVAAAGRNLLRSDFLQYPNTNTPYVDATRNAASSNYQSLQVQFSRRLARGLQALASYTYSHSIDDSSNAETALYQAVDGFPNPNADKGNSDFDLRHAVRGALTYNIPTWNADALSKAIFGGWSVDTIAIAQSGLPVNLSGENYFPTNCNGCELELRPDVVSGVPLYISGAECRAANGGTPCPGGKAINFTPGAVAGGCPDGSQSKGPFCPVPADANGDPIAPQGNLGRNVLRGLGMWQTDFALHRQFNITEHLNLQFRGELFNIFNHPNFGLPDSTVTDGTFGRATETLNESFGTTGLNPLYAVGGPRSVQFALKLAF